MTDQTSSQEQQELTDKILACIEVWENDRSRITTVDGLTPNQVLATVLQLLFEKELSSIASEIEKESFSTALTIDDEPGEEVVRVRSYLKIQARYSTGVTLLSIQ